MRRPHRIQPGPGQESVWDYPRPPALDPSHERVEVRFDGELVASTTAAIRVLETSHPPTYYLPSEDIVQERLRPAGGSSYCEWKGVAVYFDVVADRVAARAAWSYPNPTAGFEAIAGHVAFYPGSVECSVDGELVSPQPGGFYGGWITTRVVGPFKGSPGTMGW